MEAGKTETKYEMLTAYPREGLHGRRKITTNAKAITPDNVVRVITQAYSTHLQNKAEIQFLYDYYRGKQDICHKTRPVREASANNIVMANHANEIVTFKTAYLLGEPIQYISEGNSKEISDSVNTLNTYMREDAKESLDKELADWMHICGVGVRMVRPAERGSEAPVLVYTLDPREAFCVYSGDIDGRRMAGVIEQEDFDGNKYLAVYTDKFYCEIKGDSLNVLEATDMFPAGTTHPHIMRYVPIIEYSDNIARMGAFESVIPLLNAINQLESARTDGVQDFVNAYDVFQNCEISKDTYTQLSQGGQAIQITSNVAGLEAKVYRIASELNQQGTQTAIDDLETKILTICGMPSLGNGNAATSDNVGAVIYRQGYFSAESRAKNTEKAWKRYEKEFLRIVMEICPELNLNVSDVSTAFLRNNYSDLQSKTQVLCELLNNDKVDPKYAYEASGLFEDSETAYKAGMAWYDKQQAELEKQITDDEQNDETQTEQPIEGNTDDTEV